MLQTLNVGRLGNGRLEPSEDGGGGDRLPGVVHGRLMEMSLERPRTARAVARRRATVTRGNTHLERRVR